MLYVSPENWEELNSPAVVVASDAATNNEAEREIGDWAGENSFARTTEPYLRIIRRNGRNLFQGVCYRITEEHLDAAREMNRRTDERIARMTPHVLVES